MARLSTENREHLTNSIRGCGLSWNDMSIYLRQQWSDAVPGSLPKHLRASPQVHSLQGKLGICVNITCNCTIFLLWRLLLQGLLDP